MKGLIQNEGQATLSPTPSEKSGDITSYSLSRNYTGDPLQHIEAGYSPIQDAKLLEIVERLHGKRAFIKKSIEVR